MAGRLLTLLAQQLFDAARSEGLGGADLAAVARVLEAGGREADRAR